MKYIVQLGDFSLAYLKNGEGDPPRTVLKENAKQFGTIESAKNEIVKACKTHTHRKALVYRVLDENGIVIFRHESNWGSVPE